MQNALALINEAVAHQQAGRFAEAETLYKSVLAMEADNPDALAFYGGLKLRQGDAAGAVPLLRRAVEKRPDHIFSHLALGNALLRNGEADAAINAYCVLLKLQPSHTGALTNMGVALRSSGRVDAALKTFRAALALDPDLYVARAGLATALLMQQDFKTALAEASTVLNRHPDHPEALFVAGTALKLLGQDNAAEPVLRQAVAADPSSPHIKLNHANSLARQDKLDEAIAACRAVIAAEPRLIEAHASLICMLTDAGLPGQAMEVADTALQLAPEDPQLHWNKGVAALLAGSWDIGWQEYAWRKKHPDHAAKFRDLPGMNWQGADLAGQTLLVMSEQGMGETIQFCRLLPWLAAGGARIVLACAAPLVPLLAQLPGVHAVNKDGELPAYDCWVDLMDIPGIMRLRPTTVPNAKGYLQADRARARQWKAALPEGAKVGLVWAGNPLHANDHRRSVPAVALAPLLNRRGVEFVSLQVGRSDSAIISRSNVFDAAPALGDFRETAAVIANLDLVIAVDTATAHLAAAMGKPVWLMLAHAPDWRWMLERGTTPWYAGMRLFRQATPGDWGDVIRRIDTALSELVAYSRDHSHPGATAARTHVLAEFSV